MSRRTKSDWLLDVFALSWYIIMCVALAAVVCAWFNLI